MGLTDKQRAELTAIREDALAIAPHSYTRHARPAGGKEVFKAWSRKLDALGEAWAALDTDTQMQLLVTIVTQWTDDGSEGVPDLSMIAGELKKGLALPQHREEDYPGLIAATKFLWGVWITDQPGVVPIDQAAISAISTSIVPTFGLSHDDAKTRVENILRGWDKGKKANGLLHSDMPGRGALNLSDTAAKGRDAAP